MVPVGQMVVILITTKRGKDGKTTINFSAKTGINSRAIPEYEIMTDPKMYIETYWEALRNSQTYDGSSDEDAAAYASSTLIDDLVYNPYNVANGEVVGSDGKLNPNAQLLYYDNWADEMYKKRLPSGI